MKKIYYLITVLVLGCALFLVNCKDKEAEPTPDPRTKTQLITASVWKITTMVCDTSVDTDGKDRASKDLLSQKLPCQNDDTYLFKSDSTTTEYTNVKCNANEKVSYKGAWIFTNAEKTLTWNGANYPILELTGTKMVLRYTLTASGNVYGITITLAH